MAICSKYNKERNMKISQGFLLFLYLLIVLQEGEGGERERNINLLFHFLMHSLVAFCIDLLGDRTHNFGVLG